MKLIGFILLALAALAQEKPAPKPVELTAEDRLAVLQLKSQIDDAYRAEKEAQKRQAELTQQLQKLLGELGKKCGGRVALDNEHHVICQKPEAPKEAPNAQPPR